MKSTPRVVSLFFLLAIVAAVLGHASPASAATEVINVPAIAFTAGSNALYLEADGVVEGEGAVDVARAPIQFTQFGLQICRFRMWAHDNSAAGGVTARLIRKQITADASSAFGPPPELIASVSSTGMSDTMRRFTTSAVSAPKVTVAYFYWVELDWNGLSQVSGLRIEAQTACG